MGDLSTHAEIAKENMKLLAKSRGWSKEQALFFELGNFLTDVSQVRDPFGHVFAKTRVWQAARDKTWKARLPFILDDYIELDEYLDELFGKPGPEGGKLAEWLRSLVFAIGVEKFRKRGLKVDDFKYIFDNHWTQYWPHEHLDFPPWPYKKVLGDRTQSKLKGHDCRGNRPGKARRVPASLDEQIVYLSDLLSKVEIQWARATPTASNLRDRNELISRYGHASHALEDFFFHSNFIEFGWKQLGRALPTTRPAKSGNPAPEFAIDGTRAKRVWYRRMQAPTEEDNELSKEADATQADTVYTSSFGGEDVFHIGADLVQGLMKMGSGTVPPGIKETVDPSASDEEKERRLIEHRRRLKPDPSGHSSYDSAIDISVLADEIHLETANALKHMNKIDWELGEAYPNPGPPLGVLGFIQQLGGMVDKIHARSEKESDKLDKDNIQVDKRSDNKASAENIGSHTLLAKDSSRKEPLRGQAIEVATTATLAVTTELLRSVKRNVVSVARSHNGAASSSRHGAKNTVKKKDYVDWEHMLQHFICSPEDAVGPGDTGDEQHWWIKATTGVRAGSGHVVKYITEKEALKRAEEETKKELEARYTAMERLAEADWRKVLAEARGTDRAALAAIVIGVIVGGIAGAIAGNREGGIPGAIAGGIVGAAAGGAGAAIGAQLGSAIFGAGPAGAFVGGLVGAAIGAAAAGTLAKYAVKAAKIF